MPGKKKKYNARFPPARIKKIMQTDEEVGKVAAAVPVIISRGLEMFVESLLTRAGEITNARNARTLTPAHLKQCIMAEKRFDFLQDLVATVPDISGDMDCDATPLTPSTPLTPATPLTSAIPLTSSSPLTTESEMPLAQATAPQTQYPSSPPPLHPLHYHPYSPVSAGTGESGKEPPVRGRGRGRGRPRGRPRGTTNTAERGAPRPRGRPRKTGVSGGRGIVPPMSYENDLDSGGREMMPLASHENELDSEDSLTLDLDADGSHDSDTDEEVIAASGDLDTAPRGTSSSPASSLSSLAKTAVTRPQFLGVGDGTPQVSGLHISIGGHNSPAIAAARSNSEPKPSSPCIPTPTLASTIPVIPSPTITSPALPPGIQISIPGLTAPSPIQSPSTPRPPFGVPVPVIKSIISATGQPPPLNLIQHPPTSPMNHLPTPRVKKPPPDLLPINLSATQVDEDYDS